MLNPGFDKLPEEFKIVFHDLLFIFKIIHGLIGQLIATVNDFSFYFFLQICFLGFIHGKAFQVIPIIPICHILHGLDIRFEFTFQLRQNLNEVSSGQKQKILLARELINRPALLLMDEPFTHLNPLQIEKVKDLLNQYKTRKGLIITDHMFHHIIDISDTLYLLKDGKTNLIRHSEELEELGYAKF